jgi:hypothetical protein
MINKLGLSCCSNKRGHFYGKFSYMAKRIEDYWRIDTLNMLVKHFKRHDMISDHEELKKYYLDETGKYKPKLKK